METEKRGLTDSSMKSEVYWYDGDFLMEPIYLNAIVLRESSEVEYEYNHHMHGKIFVIMPLNTITALEDIDIRPVFEF